jgi:predicted porin
MGFSQKFTPAILLSLCACAGGAHAQSSLTLYGLYDISFGSFQSSYNGTGTNPRTTQVSPSPMTTSYIGFKGVEDLGNGLKALFTMESFFRGDIGASGRSNTDVFWARNANVALAGGFGKVAIGRMDNLLFLQALAFNPLGGAFGFSPTIRLTFGAFGNDKGDSGWSNSVAYTTPTMAGFTLAGQFQTGEAADKSEGNSAGLSGTYVLGGFAIGGGYQVVKSAELPKANLTAGQKQTFGLLGTSYDFGVVKLFGQYGQFKNKGFSANADKIDTKLYQVGVSVPVMSVAKVLASWGQSKESAVEGGTTPDVKHSIFTLAYDHNLSKRTDLYAAYMLDDEDQTGWKKGNTFAVGMRHRF